MEEISKTSFLGPVDTAFLHVETEKSPMNIGGIAIFEGSISYNDLLEHVRTRIHQAPLYQKRLVQAPFNAGQPSWGCDPYFTVENHVFHTRLDAPGTDAQLRDLASRLVSSRLERSKPLWEIYLIEGLQNGRTALFFKVHHAMVDGISAIDLFTIMLDLTPDVQPTAEIPLYDPPPLPSAPQSIWDGLTQELPYKLGVLNKLGNNLGLLGNVLGDREKRRRMLLGIANLVNDNLNPLSPLAINGKNTGDLHLTWSEFSLNEVRAIRSKANTSVNDVMLTVLAGAIDRYETRSHGLAGRNRRTFRVLIPVNMRVENEKSEYGNRISVLPIDIPLGVDDPLQRLQKVVEYTRTMKQSNLSLSVDMLLTLPALYPAVAQPLIWSIAPAAFAFLAHSWCTNVAGPQIPVYLLGHEMLHSYGYFPLNPSMGLACVVMSYNQKIAMTLVTDAGIIPDANEIQHDLEASYLELREAAQVGPAAPILIEKSKDDLSLVVPAPTPAFTVIASPLISTNGGTATAVQEKAEAVVEVVVDETPSPKSEPVVEASSITVEKEPIKLFSEAWAQAYRTAINENGNYRRVSTNWEAGSLAFVMKASPRNGFPADSAVWMDLHKGECRAACSLAPREAIQRAAFVIEGDYPSWMHVLQGNTPPLLALIRGELHLKKGSLIKLLPFTQSAQELLHSAQRIPQE